jgi:hypothetical protein
MVDERGQRQMRGERATAVDERQQKLRQDVVRPTADKRRQRLWWWMRGASWARGDGGGRREVMIWWRWPAEA